ncbi:hypothetical protein ABW20_dc0100630 [Dactylellina cionopaga]|nr:hypothetical protein ABW20_dc0100630 [Dactylellina cionopaga]
MAKAKKKASKPSTSTSTNTDQTSTCTSDASTPPIKAEDINAGDTMLIDSDVPQADSSNAMTATSSTLQSEDIKTESRTVSPSPPSPPMIATYQPRYDFDGALLQEEPDFNEDFIPAEGEEIDLTSLAVPVPVPEGENPAGNSNTGAHKRNIDEADESGAFEDTQTPITKRRKVDETDVETPPTLITIITPITTSLVSTSASATSVDRLPPVLWTEIFTYIGLPGIGRLRATCKRFDELLGKEYIWRRCRKIHCPDMPKPAFGMKEWDMWGLVRGRGCMKCEGLEGKVRGEDGMKVYWQFRVRCCEGCFRGNVVKEAELLGQADKTVSPEVMKELISALPYGLVDTNFAWVPTTIPNQPDVEKVYWSEDIAEVKERYEEALQMDAAEEWLKGLEGEGHGHKADADRMEKWEVRVMHGNSYNPSATAAQQQHQKKNSGDKVSGQQNPTPKTNSGIPVLVSNDNPPFQPQSIPTFYQRNRQYGDRSHQDVEDVKTRRKADIEARCLKLDPPLLPEILAHCSAFQASLKIAQPLNEQSWTALLPKILEQRVGAEEFEKQKQAQRKQLEQQLEDRRLLESQERDQWVKKERQWEESQSPVRDMLAKLADEEIKAWHGKVTFESAPAFAASVLTAVRTRYYEQGGVKEASSASNSTSPSNNSTAITIPQDDRPRTRQLVLENMKYVFDNKIKPMTDPCRRELFFCKACNDIAANPSGSGIPTLGPPPPSPPKLYGFEGVIQHFAAKHTTDMSLGTVVVHWRSVWPEGAPFVVDPNEIKRLMTRPTGGGHQHHQHHQSLHHASSANASEQMDRQYQ